MCAKAFCKRKCLTQFEAITSFFLLPTYLLRGRKYNATSWHVNQNYLGRRLESLPIIFSAKRSSTVDCMQSMVNMERIPSGKSRQPSLGVLEIRETEQQELNKEAGFMPLITCDSVQSKY